MGASEPQPPQPPQLPPDDDDALFLENVPQDLRYDTLEGEREREGEREGDEGKSSMLMQVEYKVEEAELVTPVKNVTDAAAGASLTNEELIRRRKQKISDLIALYKEQYWVLADELCARAQKFQSKLQGSSKEGAVDDEEKKEYASLEDYYKDKRDVVSVVSTTDGVGGEGGDGGVPSFSDIEELVFSQRVKIDATQLTKEARIRRRKHVSKKLPTIKELEKTALAMFSRHASKKGALACLMGKKAAFYLSRPEASLGRNTKFQMVDIDLSMEGSCAKVSRQQGMIRMHAGGSFYFQNFGQRKVRVDNVSVPYKRRAVLQNGSFLDVGGLRFVFLMNPLVKKLS